MKLELTQGSTQTFQIELQFDDGSDYDPSGLTSARILFNTEAGQTPFFDKTITTPTSSTLEVPVLQAEADAWPIGLHLGQVIFSGTNAPKSDIFYVEVSRDLS